MPSTAVVFSATVADQAQITAIVRRTHRIFPELFAHGYDGLDLRMDLEATHSNGCPLDFQKLLDAPEFDFVHDIGGIKRHLDRKTGALRDCFVPRCALSKAVGNG